MNRRFIGIIFAMLVLAFFSHGQAWAVTMGTTDGTYDFGSLGAADSAGTGYARLGDKFKVDNGLFTQAPSYNTGPLTAIYATSGSPATYTSIIKAEGSSTCKTFTFKDLGISAYVASQTFNSLSIVLKDISGVQIGSAISLGSSGTIPTASVINISTLYSHAAWSIDNVASIEITYTIYESGIAGHAYDLNFENITIANVSAPSGAPVVFSATPSYGPPAAGTSVVIAGGGFTGATAVKFGGTNAASYTVDSASQITAIAPAGSAGSVVHITVTTPLGTNTTSAADQYTYITNTLGTADDIYNFGSLGVADSAGTGYAKLGDKFKVGNTLFTQGQSYNTGPPIAIYPNTSTTSPYTAIIKAEGGSTCKTFTFKDLGISAYLASHTFNTLSIVLKDINGVQIGSAISLGSSGTIPNASVINISTLYSHAAWSIDNVASIEITYTLYASGAPVTSQNLSFENITIANVSAPSGAPVVFSATPSYGPPAAGTSVVIAGGGFTGATAVKFGGTNAVSYTVDSAAHITAVAPAGTVGSIVHITVTTPLGTNTTSAADQFTYITNTLGTADDTYNFGSLGAADSAGTGYAKLGDKFKVGNGLFTQTQSYNAGPPIALYTTTNTTSPYTSIIKAEGGSTCKTFTFKDLGISAYVASQTFNSLSIVLKDISGVQIGSAISLGSSGTIPTASVINISTLYSHAAWSIDNVASIEITYTLYASGSPVTSQDLNLENITIANLSASPTVTGISPSSAPAAGGTAVTITGTNFTGATSVTIGGASATSVIVVNATTISAVTPAGTAGARDVVVTTPGGTGTGTGLFTYVAAPTVTAISPTVGPTAGGTAVTITGTNFTGATSVTIGGASATSVIVVNATTISAVTPAGTAGARDVVVTTPGGTGMGTGLFTYVAAPTVTAISPTVGPTAGGTAVTISGTNFTGATSITIGGASATSVIVVNATTITAVTPAGTAGARDVVVTTPGGTGTGTGLFAYAAAPTVTAISPTSGPTAGGTAVTITGTNFTGATSVTIGGAAATSVVVVNATTITAVTPAGTAGAQNVAVTTPGGTGTGTGLYTYITAPSTTVLTAALSDDTGGSSIDWITNAAAQTISGTLSANLTTGESVQVSYDGGSAWTTATAYSVGSNVWSTTTTLSGSNSFEARVTNSIGSSTAYTHTYMLDTTLPSLLLSTLGDGSVTNNPTLNFSGTASDANGVQSVVISSQTVTLHTTNNIDYTFSYPVTLATGSNVIITVATDNAGNTATDTRTIVLDQTAPNILVSAPADNSVTSNPTVTLSGTTDTSATVLVSINSGPTVTAGINITSFSLLVSLATNSINTIDVYATDLAGNTATAKRTVTNDQLNPSLAVTVPNQDMGTNQTGITLSGTVSDLTNVDLLVTCPTASVGAVNTPTTTTWNADLTNLQPGVNSVTIQATDLAGNSTSVIRNIITTTTPVTIDPVTSPTTTHSQTISGTREENAAVAVLCPTATIGVVSYPSPTTWQMLLTLMTTGTNTITVAATDVLGNVSSPVTAVIVVSASSSGTPSGDITNDGMVDARDALKALMIASGMEPATTGDLASGDVAPLVSGTPQPNGRIDIGDVVVILRKAVGLVTW